MFIVVIVIWFCELYWLVCFIWVLFIEVEW